jgi:hypothetical protein
VEPHIWMAVSFIPFTSTHGPGGEAAVDDGFVMVISLLFLTLIPELLSQVVATVVARFCFPIDICCVGAGAKLHLLILILPYTYQTFLAAPPPLLLAAILHCRPHTHAHFPRC